MVGPRHANTGVIVLGLATVVAGYLLLLWTRDLRPIEAAEKWQAGGAAAAFGFLVRLLVSRA
jgi:hypothetical protein